ncbi:hypothetical protein AB0M80_19225 [Amycolatopsis sp. NPDC051045]|uniref:hypothetical protein n=1 Tax=Amycolatopsis sp. NPDC051045 TaxID=3156922 RepID=UPI00343C07CE
MTPPDPDADSPAAAGRLLLDSLAARVAVDEAVGILQGWQGCDAAQARHDLTGGAGLGAEAARVAAVVDARADGTADPDFGDRG